MFCIYCGYQLPNSAQFCSNCGALQTSVSPAETSKSETINHNDKHTFMPAMCPNCNAHMKVDTSLKIARCNACGTECLVQDAINNFTVRGNVQVENATINVNGFNDVSNKSNIERLLQRVEVMLGDGDFSGAISKCEPILDLEPRNATVYVYLLMASLNCRRRIDLSRQPIPYDNNRYYINAMQFGDEKLQDELFGYLKSTVTYVAIKQKRPQVGDLIYFGSMDGQRIWWKVLRVNEHSAYIISNEILINMAYHDGGVITWSDCTLRKWLNDEFIKRCFKPSEQERIILSNVDSDMNPRFNTRHGKPTTDKVFLLSINEINFYFPKNEDRSDGSLWWLRSRGFFPYYSAFVDNDGNIVEFGEHVSQKYGVRPAMWIILE